MKVAASRIANFILAVAGLALVAGASFMFWRPEPVQYYHKIVSSSVRPAIISQGEPLHTHVEVDRKVPADCVLEIHRFISDSMTGVVVWDHMAPGLATEGFQTITRRVVPIPPLPVGHYTYHFRAFNICGSGMAVFAQSQGATFEVR